jgi:pilus assembly protein CpaB
VNQNKPRQVAAAPPTEQVLVAGGQLQAGALLQPGDIAAAAMVLNAAPADANLDTPANRAALVGSMIRLPIGQGAPILNSAVIHPGDHGFLAAVLAPGMRATTIGVDAISGAAGLIWPGDHVDVLLTQTLDDMSVPVGQRIAAELVLQDVRVIATGQQLVQGVVAANGGPPTPPATTVTLEVTPDQAERCAVAGHLGPLSLVVHSSQAPSAAVALAQGAPAPVWANQVSPALTTVHPDAPVITTIHLFDGDSSDQDFKF